MKPDLAHKLPSVGSPTGRLGLAGALTVTLFGCSSPSTFVGLPGPEGGTLLPPHEDAMSREDGGIRRTDASVHPDGARPADAHQDGEVSARPDGAHPVDAADRFDAVDRMDTGNTMDAARRGDAKGAGGDAGTHTVDAAEGGTVAPSCVNGLAGGALCPVVILLATGPTSSGATNLGGGLGGQYDPVTHMWTTTALTTLGPDLPTLTIAGTVGVGLTHYRNSASSNDPLNDALLYATWTPGAWVDFQQLSTDTTQSAPSIAGLVGTTSGGTADAVFQGNDYHHYVTVYDTATKHWSAATDLTTYSGGGAAIAVLGSSSSVVFNNGGSTPVNAFSGQDIVANAGQAPLQITTSNTYGPRPTVVALTTGAELLAVAGTANNEVLWFTRSHGDWSSGAILANVLLSATPGLTALPGGNALLAFEGQDHNLYYTLYTAGSGAAAGTWSAVAPVSGASNLVAPPAVAPGVGGDTAELAFVQTVSGGNNVAYHTRLVDGGWTTPVAVGGTHLAGVAIASAPADVCEEGTCSSGQRCAAGVCVCDANSCDGCCSGVNCESGTAASACGTGGAACLECAENQACSARACSGSLTESVAVFGGQDGSEDDEDDTWTFGGRSWLSGPSNGPQARTGATMATLGQKAVLFGGIGPSMGGVQIFGDTWTFDGTTWTGRTLSGPSQRHGGSLAALPGKVVLFGGEGAFDESDPLGDTWLYNGTQWSAGPTAGPPARRSAAMASLGAKVVLFGGSNTQDGTNPLGDTWIFNGTSWAPGPTSGPPARSGAVMAALNGKVVLFGGSGGDQLLDDTWIFDGTGWTPVTTTSPSARAGAAGATLGGKVVLFGGNSSTTDFNDLGDLWTFDGTGWTQVAVVGPVARVGASMATLP